MKKILSACAILGLCLDVFGANLERIPFLPYKDGNKVIVSNNIIAIYDASRIAYMAPGYTFGLDSNTNYVGTYVYANSSNIFLYGPNYFAGTWVTNYIGTNQNNANAPRAWNDVKVPVATDGQAFQYLGLEIILTNLTAAGAQTTFTFTRTDGAGNSDTNGNIWTVACPSNPPGSRLVFMTNFSPGWVSNGFYGGIRMQSVNPTNVSATAYTNVTVLEAVNLIAPK